MVVTAREPGGTPLGEEIRALVLHGHEMTPWAEALLYVAARAELVAEVVAPALERGDDVILDRYVDSSVAYQGVGRGLGLDEVLELNLQAVGGLLPDRTFVLVVEPGSLRVARRRLAGPDRARAARVPRQGRRRLRAARRALSRARRPARRHAARRERSPHGSTMSFVGLPEQPEAARLLGGRARRGAGARLPPARSGGRRQAARRAPRSPPACSATSGACSSGTIPTSTCSSRSAR